MVSDTPDPTHAHFESTAQKAADEMVFFDENVSIENVDLDDVFDNLEDTVGTNAVQADSDGGEE